MRNIKWEDELNTVMRKNRFRMYALFVAIAINILLIGYYAYQIVSEPLPTSTTIKQASYDDWETLEEVEDGR